MTSIDPRGVPARPGPPVAPHPHATSDPGTGPRPRPAHRRAGRLAGVDAARGIAVLGMIIVHVAAADSGSPVVAAVAGRSAVLFAVLGGVSLALMAAPVLRAGDAAEAADRARLRRRVAVRAVLLVALGIALAGISSGPMVILAVYGVEFLLVTPLLLARARTLAVLAGVWALAGPLVSFALRSGMDVDTLGGTIAPSDLTSFGAAGDAVLRLLLTGAYPVLTWMPFLLLGMAIGRLDLAARAGRVVIGGLLGAAVGYGGSWLAVNVLGGRQALLDALAPVARSMNVTPSLVLDLLGTESLGTTPTTTPAWLLVSGAHTGTPFEIVGAAGTAAAVLGLCLLVGRAVPALLAPLAATGALALTLYAGHIVVLAAVASTAAEHPWPTTVTFLVAAVLLACGWRGLARRGPLEAAVHVVSTRVAGAA